ncbi:hypothetical protein FACS1894102_3260 [Spirochaetia bacterium]|nr:hypothetical protein FACS1894102_3260 [Spirochaetia bacterium]
MNISARQRESNANEMDNCVYRKSESSHESLFEQAIADYECPLDHTPNAETIAAIKEGKAMLRGEIPCKRFNSFNEFWDDLNG